MQTFLFPAFNLFNLSLQTPRTILPVIPPLTNILLPPTGVIGIFAQVTVAGVVRIRRLGSAHTAFGGIRFTFLAPEAAWFQVIFLGDNVATASVT